MSEQKTIAEKLEEAKQQAIPMIREVEEYEFLPVWDEYLEQTKTQCEQEFGFDQWAQELETANVEDIVEHFKEWFEEYKIG